MKQAISELHDKAAHFYAKHQDAELRGYLLELAQRLEEADMLRHQFAYFLMHTQSTIAVPSRPKSWSETHRYCGHVSSVRRVPVLIASCAARRPRALDRCATCRFTPQSRAIAATAEMATASASAGRDSRRSE